MSNRSLSWRAWLAPGQCLLCQQRTGRAFDLCAECQRVLPWNAQACSRCAAPFPAASSDAKRAPSVCGTCTVAPPVWDSAFAVFRYAPPVDLMIRQLKFGGSLCDARVLATLLADRLSKHYVPGALPDIVTPVPLSWRRLVRRGHNQSALIARFLCARLGRGARYDVLRRTRHTRPQSQLNRSERHANPNGAFRSTEALSGMSVALVDDVMTTGATARAAARALKIAGAAEVHVWVLARA